MMTKFRCGPFAISFLLSKPVFTMTDKAPRILSVQSHTTHGYVGNKAATFPLQTLGFDVNCINTVSLSNHPAYRGGCKGNSLQLHELLGNIEGLENNNLLNYDAVITGYISKV